MTTPDSIRSLLRDRYLSLNWDAPWEEVVTKLAEIRGAAMQGMTHLHREYIDSLPSSPSPRVLQPKLTVDDL